MNTEYSLHIIQNRRRFLAAMAGLGVGTATFHRALAAQVAQGGDLTGEMIAHAEWIAGIELDEEDRTRIAQAVTENLKDAGQLRETQVDADTVPALVFRPDFFYQQTKSADVGEDNQGVHVAWSAEIAPQQMSDEQLAFARLSVQASLLAKGQISSRELTQLYLARLQKYDPLLHCVVTLLEEHALEQAEASDERRQRDHSIGILDGIPWLAKDLIAVPPWKTTWGAEPFKDQVRNQTATVATRMSQAGAVLLAKVSLGALAWGDKWFDGLTRNPWNPEQGSSGSSAGSASAVAAGLATFALGSETLGSIISPTRRCRTCGLRPTFGRVSRAGCMPLAWSMDKIGPIARHIEDLAYVFPNLLGPDGRDPTLVSRGFRWPLDLHASALRVGVTGDDLNKVEQQALDTLQAQGAQVVELKVQSKLPVDAMNFILGVEASTVFDDAFRQEPAADYGLWTSTFQKSQFVPAIQYLRANRLRGQLISETQAWLAQVDVVLGGDDLLLTNLTGHPSLVVTCGSDEVQGVQMPGVVKLTAAAYREQQLLHVAHMLQTAIPPTPSQPTLDEKLR